MTHSFPTRRSSELTEDEKVNIAERYLKPKQMRNNGLLENELAIEEGAVRDIIRYYNRETGVRGLEREIAKIRSEEHTSELQSLMRSSYAVFCLTTKKTKNNL